MRNRYRTSAQPARSATTRAGLHYGPRHAFTLSSPEERKIAVITPKKSVVLAVGMAAVGAFALSACGSDSSSSSSASASPTISSASPTSAAPTPTTASPKPTSAKPTTAGRTLNPAESFFKVTGASKVKVTSGTIEGLTSNPSTVIASGQTSAGAFNLNMKVNSSGTVTSANLTIGGDTYKSVGSSGSVEFGDSPPGVAVSTQKAITVTENGGNGTLALKFSLVTTN